MAKPILPFHSDTFLSNIVTGVTAPASVNVHKLHSIGSGIVAKMKENPVFTFKAKRSDRVKTLGSAAAVTSTVDADIEIDPALLFQRMMTVAASSDMNLADIMHYELCAFPPALFESRSMLRKADKSQLAHAILKKSDELRTEVVEIQSTDQYVIDGGSLLQRIPWHKHDTYENIANSYATFTLQHYGKAIIVFDGYDDSPSIKDMTHRRRRNSQMSTAVKFTKDMKFVGQKDKFLSNDKNKQLIILLIAEKLRKHGCTVQHAVGDADVDIVRAAILSSEHSSTTIIGEDTDLLILLLYHAKNYGFKLYYRSDIKRGSSMNPVYDILGIQALLGTDICKYLLFLHAYTGCDTTYRFFSVGKAKAFGHLLKEKELQVVANIFCSEDSQHVDIENAGKKALLVLYGCRKMDSINTLRHRMLLEKVVAAKSFVTPERLPPTESATKYHSFRTYYQIRAWQSTEENLNPKEWGWYEKDNSFWPTICDLPPAPDLLLNMIRCSCTTHCATMRCACKKNVMPCSAACGECQVSGCDNCVTNEYEDSSSDADD